MRSLFLWVMLLAAGCAGETPEGLYPTEHTGGPEVIWDVFAKPLPLIPLPNDAATRPSDDSPTGIRLNISLQADTRFERRMRHGFNQLDGFGTYGPIYVQFDVPLDVEDLWERHNGGPWPQGGSARDDFRDDAVFLLNVDPSCKRFGEEVALDMGRGRFPVVLDKQSIVKGDPSAPEGITIQDRNVAFDNDPHTLSNNLLFEERNEDKNGNGHLDPGEDTDHDGHLDIPNFMDPNACEDHSIGSLQRDQCIVDQLLTFYDREDNTLILRPVWPLEERCTHAVVLTKRLKGTNGLPVQSPFPQVNHAEQTTGLAPLVPLLSRYELSVEDIAFAWSFKTGSMTHDLEALRKGLYGHGPFARLKDEFPTSSLEWYVPQEGERSGAVLKGACAGLTLSKAWDELINEWIPNLCALDADFSHLGGVFHGTFQAPNLMVNKEGMGDEFYPMDSKESWDLDASKGEATYGSQEVTFWCFLPREKADVTCEEHNPEGIPFCKPYPVVFYSHGYGGSRAGLQDSVGRAASMGFASCSMDAYGHGGNRQRLSYPNGILEKKFSPFGAQEMETIMLRGRDRDLNNDGIPDPGGDFWTNDIFHTRDMLRQTVLEWMQFIRIIRSFDGIATNESGELLGDPDLDGVVDLGGPKTVLGLWGISLGGIVAGILKGAEPSLNAASPNAGGAGLTDIGVRSIQAGVPEAVILPILGTLLVGSMEQDPHQNPLPGAALVLAFRVNDVGNSALLPFHEVQGVQVGDKVIVENLDKPLKRAEAYITQRGTLRLSVAADALGPLERRPLLGLEGADTGPRDIENPVDFGDRLQVTIYQGNSGTIREVVNTFDRDLLFQGSRYRENTSLVALQEGLGYQRNTPDFRRFLGIAQHALDPADPAIWAAKVAVDPIDASYDPNWTEEWKGGHTRVLYMPTLGDPQVPINTGIAEARVGGLFGSWIRDKKLSPEYGWRALFRPDSRFGHSIEHELISRFVVEGVDRLERFGKTHPHLPHQQVLYDVDDYGDGATQWSCIQEESWAGDWDKHNCPEELIQSNQSFQVPTAEPGKTIRAVMERQEGRFDSVRMPLIRPTGQHGIYNPQPFRPFDADTHMSNYTLRFLGSGGARVDHVEGCDCSSLGAASWQLQGEPTLGLEGTDGACETKDLKVCSPACAKAWGIQGFSEPNACSPPE